MDAHQAMGAAGGLSRRRFAQGAALAAASLAAGIGHAAADWTVLQVAPLTGVNGGVGWHLRLGALAAFEAANAAGGVAGRPLRLWTLDEEPGRVAAQLREAAATSAPLALMGLHGRRSLAELARSGVPAELGLPVVGVKSGSAAGTGFDAPWLFVTRGSYRQEIEQVLRHAATIYARRIALVTTDDEDGREVEALARQLAAAAGVEIVPAPRHPADSAEVAPAVAAVLGQPHDAVLLATNTAAVAYFAKLYTAAGGRRQLVALSTAEATQLALVVGAPAAHGLLISQVVPHPRDARFKLMRDLVQAWRRYGPADVAPTLAVAEGYVGARVLVDALQRTGPAANSTALTRTLAGSGTFDLGGLRLSLQRNGPHFRSLSVIGRDGNVLS